MNAMYKLRLSRALVVSCLVTLSIPARADTSDSGRYRFQTGYASYYSAAKNYLRTATGEREDPNGLTAAHEYLPLGSWVRVTNLFNGRTVNVRINDRKAASQTRVIDLSRRAAQLVGMMSVGLARVKIEPIPAPRQVGTASVPHRIGTN